MKTAFLIFSLLGTIVGAAAPPGTIFETLSAYHHIRVVDQNGIRTLSFDNSQETRMSLANPLTGHFEYTEFFHMPWLWNGRLTNVLMIGLGGGSTQRSYAHYYTNTLVETVEIDPVVLRVAKEYFHFQESTNQRVHVMDGRLFLRRSQAKYGAIMMDAYVQHRYGASIPYHLATKEFFELAAAHLATNGVLAYNVMGTMQGRQTDLVGTLYKTMKTVFPHVYFFPSRESVNVVVIGSTSPGHVTFDTLHQRASSLIAAKWIKLPNFRERVYAFRDAPPFNISKCRVLTDDFAPVDGLLNTGM